MSEVQRICAQCGASGALDARYCPRCGYDFQAQLPAPQQNLPLIIGKAALPIVLGAASLALRIGWRLLQSRWAQQTAQRAVGTALSKVQPTTPQPAPPGGSPAHARRTIHIRSSWAVGDANGVWRQGHSEHHIELDE